MILKMFFMILSYFRSVAESLLRSDETHLTVVLTSHEDHSLGLDATDLARCKIGEDADLLADHLLRRILLGDARNDHPLVDACVDCKLQELVGLWHSLSLEDCSCPYIHLLEVVECTLFLLRSDHSCLSCLCGRLSLGTDSLKACDLSVYYLVFNLGKEKGCRVELMACREE